jgi:hypothetical protein
LKLTRFVLGVALLVGILFFQLAPPVQAQRGALVLPRNLLQLVQQAETIVVGQVVSARAEKHPELKNLNTVVVTLRVRETWKGAEQPTLTFRQYVWDIRDWEDRLDYRKGQEVLLLLNGTSRIGLTSPAGLYQGRFRILRDSRGRRYGVNGLANRALFKEMPRQLRWEGIDLGAPSQRLVETHQQGPISYEALRTLIREMVRVE